MIQLKFPLLKSWSFFLDIGYRCFLFVHIYLYLYTYIMRCFPMCFRRFPLFTGPPLSRPWDLISMESRIWPSQQKFFWRNVSSMCHQTSRVGGNLQGFQHGKPEVVPENSYTKNQCCCCICQPFLYDGSTWVCNWTMLIEMICLDWELLLFFLVAAGVFRKSSWIACWFVIWMFIKVMVLLRYWRSARWMWKAWSFRGMHSRFATLNLVFCKSGDMHALGYCKYI